MVNILNMLVDFFFKRLTSPKENNRTDKHADVMKYTTHSQFCWTGQAMRQEFKNSASPTYL